MQEEHRRVPGVAGGRVIQVVQEPSLFRSMGVFAAWSGISVLPHRGRNPVQKLPMGGHILIAFGSDFDQRGTAP